MNKTIKSPGGVTVRVIAAIEGFRSKHGYWPGALEADPALISNLVTRCLTPLGFFLLQSKVTVHEGAQGDVVTLGRGTDRFSYGNETAASIQDARAWLGLDIEE